MSARALSIAVLALPLVVMAGAACKKKPPPDEPGPPPTVDSSDPKVPAVVVPGVPITAAPQASDEPLAGKTPSEAARIYASRGQYWMARLMIEKPGLSPGAKPEDTELLATVCAAQKDLACLRACEARLGRKLKIEAGAPIAMAPFEAGAPLPVGEPDTELAKARDLVLKKDYAKARAMLEPKFLDNKATREETRLLLQVCRAQRDRMCSALCESKLK